MICHSKQYENYFEWHRDKCDFEMERFTLFKNLNICRQKKTYAMNISLQFKLNGKDH